MYKNADMKYYTITQLQGDITRGCEQIDSDIVNKVVDVLESFVILCVVQRARGGTTVGQQKRGLGTIEAGYAIPAI